MASNVQQGLFYIANLKLEVNSACYIVLISDCTDPGLHEIAELPDWALNSKHAVWLTMENKPIADRVKNGEKIRSILLNRINKNRQTTDSNVVKAS